MEQRIGSSSQPLEGEPLKGAGFDPAFIPGLTSPLSTQPGVTGSKDTGPRDAEPADEPADTAPEESAPEEAADVTDAEAEASSEATGAPEEEPAVDGPVFEAADRRARIVADAQGIRLSLDDQACEFRWDEIGAVETETARFGKRFTVTVHTPDRRWFPIEIEAKARARFKVWETELDAVLDAYFEDGDPEKADAVEAAEEAEAVSESESESDEEKAAKDKADEGKAEADKAEADEAEDSDGDDVKKDESAATKS
ncbi:hypothetical protein [Streptomyces adustus]